MRHMKSLSAAIVALSMASAVANADALPSGWTQVGNAGSTVGSDGDVTVPTGETGFSWVSTDGGVQGNTLHLGSDTNGSTALSPLFHAEVGQALTYQFNFVTSDGAGFADYGWAKLLDSNKNDYALLFTARTTPSGNTVPGFGMPALNSTINPAVVTITGGAPTWSALGSDGNGSTCFDTGCGYTGWVEASYLIAAAGDYYLQFGVANWSDTGWDTGLAWAGASIAGKPIDDDPTNDGTVPEPATLALLGAGLAAFSAGRRNRKAA